MSKKKAPLLTVKQINKLDKTAHKVDGLITVIDKALDDFYCSPGGVGPDAGAQELATASADAVGYSKAYAKALKKLKALVAKLPDEVVP